VTAGDTMTPVKELNAFAQFLSCSKRPSCLLMPMKVNVSLHYSDFGNEMTGRWQRFLSRLYCYCIVWNERRYPFMYGKENERKKTIHW